MTEEIKTISINSYIKSLGTTNTLEENIVARSIFSDFKGTRLGLAKSNDGKYMVIIFPYSGDKIIVPCENIEEASHTVEKVMLNLEKSRIKEQKGEGYGIVSALQGDRVKVEINDRGNIRYTRSRENRKVELYKQLYELYGLKFDKREMYKRIDTDQYPNDEKIQKEIKDKLFSAERFRAFFDDSLKKMLEEEIPEANQIIKKIVAVLRTEGDSYIIAKLDQITIDGKTLEKTRDVGQYLINKATLNTGEKVIDFNTQGYSDSVQNYLLKLVYNQHIKLTHEQKKGMVYFKEEGYKIMNALMRAQNEVVKKEYTMNHSIDSIVEQLLQMEAISKSLPKRNYDITLGRIGTGAHDKEKYEENIKEYSSYVSFGTNNGTDINEGNTEWWKNIPSILYKRVLKSEEPAIPIDLLCQDVLVHKLLECEILSLPMQYTEGQIQKIEDPMTDIKQIITMENITEMSVTDILETRLKGLKDFLIKERITKSLEEAEWNEKLEKYEAIGYSEDLETIQLELRDVLEQYKKSGEISEVIAFDKGINIDNKQYEKTGLDNDTHGRLHARRVAFFVRTLANLGGLTEQDKKILLFAAKNHDIGRKHDYEDAKHGMDSASMLIHTRGWEEFSEEEQELIKFIVIEHSKGQDDNAQAIERLNDEKKYKYKMMLNYLKDADKLDRVRLGNGPKVGLDASRLQLDVSKQLVKMAYQLHEFSLDISEQEKINIMLQDIEETVERVQHAKTTPITEQITTEPLRYFDDEPQQVKIVTEDKIRLGLSEINEVTVEMRKDLTQEKQTALSFGL